MHCVAGGRLLHLCDKELLILDQQPSKDRKLIGKFSNTGRRYEGRRAANLNNNLVERNIVVERLSAAEFAVIADHPGFDCATAHKLDDARDDAGMREVDLLDPLMGFSEHVCVMQFDDRKVRFYMDQKAGLELV